MASMSFEETRGKEGKRIKTRSKSNHSTKTTINHPNKKRTTWCFQWYDRMKFLVVTRHCTRRLYSTCSSHTLHALTFLLYIYIYLNTVYFLSQCNNNKKKNNKIWKLKPLNSSFNLFWLWRLNESFHYALEL
jgi:hypothetical protein